MRVVIFGANGKTGSLLVEQALAKGYQVTAYVRRKNSMVQLHPNLKIITGNLNDDLKLKKAVTGADACFSALGGSSLTKHSPEIMDGIDHIVTIMEQEGVKRLIYLSSIGAGESRLYMAQPIRFIVTNVMLRVPLADHNANEKRLAKSKLQWTVVRPGSLTNGPNTGKIIHGAKETTMKGNFRVSRANVAAFMLKQLSQRAYINKSAWLYE